MSLYFHNASPARGRPNLKAKSLRVLNTGGGFQGSENGGGKILFKVAGFPVLWMMVTKLDGPCALMMLIRGWSLAKVVRGGNFYRMHQSVKEEVGSMGCGLEEVV